MHPKRKNEQDFGVQDVKKSRRNPPSAYPQSYTGKHQNNNGGRVMTQQPHNGEQTSGKRHQLPHHLVTHSMQQVSGSPQEHQIEQLEATQQEHNPVPFTPYSELRIPILCSTNLDHSFNSAPRTEQFDSTAWTNYYSAIVMIKAGVNRKQLGLPQAKEGHGSPVTIDYVDLYLDLSDGNIYVAASDRGLLTVPDYLNLSGIAVERKLRFTGKTPEWSKAVFDAAEKRYVTKAFPGLPLPVRSELQVLDTFPHLLPPVGMWGFVYSPKFKMVIQFPLAYTTTDRESAMVRGRPGPLSAVELKHVLALPEKEPSPQELGEALFAQSREYDRSTLDMQMTKSRDDYLKECGHLYGKFAPANTQEKKGIFFESPPFTPCEDKGEFIILVKEEGTKQSFLVEWTRDWDEASSAQRNTNSKPPRLISSLQYGYQYAPKKLNRATSKADGAFTTKASAFTPY